MIVDYKNIYPQNGPIILYDKRWYNFDQWRAIPITQRGGVLDRGENLLNKYYIIFANKWLNLEAMGDFSWYIVEISFYKSGVIFIERFSFLEYVTTTKGIPTVWNCVQFVKNTPKLKDLPLEKTYYAMQINDQQELIDRVRSIHNKTSKLKPLSDFIKDK